ncbi:MAG: Lrp/AsnC family transcriptional regulator [Candidatus Eremiobacterota bacterium]
MNNYELDQIDRNILRLLQVDGRMTNAALAEAVGLTPTPMLQRIRKLEQKGVITGYSARVDPAAVGRATMAFVHVQLTEHRLQNHERFLKAVRAMPEVLEAYHVAGDDDFLLKVAVRDIAAYERFLLDRLARVPGIDRARSTFILSCARCEGALPIE